MEEETPTTQNRRNVMPIHNIRFEFPDPSSPIQKSLELVLGALLSQEPAEEVVVYMIHGPYSHRAEWEPRLADALRRFGPEVPLVLIGLIRPSQAGLGECEAFKLLTARSRIRYIDLIGREGDDLASVPGLVKAIHDVRAAAPRPLTPTELLRELRAQVSEEVLRALRHDLGHTQPGTDAEKAVLERARAKGLQGSDDELREAIRSLSVPPTLVCRGQRFAGVFCDAEGTLLVEGKPQTAVVAHLQTAQTAGRSVTVWTGGDPDALTQTLRTHGLPWDVVRKADFAGAIVEEAIDDHLEVLPVEYGITVESGRHPSALPAIL